MLITFLTIAIISPTLAEEKYIFHNSDISLVSCIHDHLTLPVDNSTRVIVAATANRLLRDKAKPYTSDKLDRVLFFLLQDLNERQESGEIFDDDADLRKLVEALKSALIGCAEVYREDLTEKPREETYEFSKGRRALLQCLRDYVIQQHRYRKSRKRVRTLESMVEAAARRFTNKKTSRYSVKELGTGLTDLFRASDVPEMIKIRVQRTLHAALVDCADEKPEPLWEGILW